VILLNKVDLVSPADLDKLEARLRAMSRTARVYRTRDAEVDIDRLLNVGAFDLDAKLELDADFLKEESPFEWGGVYHLEVGEYRFHFKPGADREMDFVLFPIASGSDQEFEIARRHASGCFAGESRKIIVGDKFTPSLELQSFVFGHHGGHYTMQVSTTAEKPAHLHWTESRSRRIGGRFPRMSGLSCRANAGAAKCYSFDAQDHVVGVGWSPDSTRDLRRRGEQPINLARSGALVT
jgi:G3E family GTPase